MDDKLPGRINTIAPAFLIAALVSSPAFGQDNRFTSATSLKGKTMRIDCASLTPDKKLTVAFLKQFDTHDDTAAWTEGGEKTQRAMLLHLLDPRAKDWSAEKITTAMRYCGVVSTKENSAPAPGK